MSFLLASRPRVTWPATAQVPSAATPGSFDAQSFSLVFEVLPPAELRALDDAFLALDPAEQVSHQHYTLERLIVGWSEVMAGTAEVPFSAEALERALALPWFPPAAYAAYAELTTGGKARLGN
ncbi:hypothetical protein [Ancylobacter lacus]|uniref:hypothetical protein n=1 Tax=Ancylobacter lacus TaxID=2579970 RepID=UPI001BCAC587|nr:hypothetical protein [Ancylobacter lacus]MBS7541498.1 hypothetical protein [Ancylobacter lacus]